jgi:RNA polymerase sigma-70 factor (ECF subfamily)
MTEDENETLLVLLVQRGSIPAFEKLLRRIYGPLRGYVTSMVGAAAADDVLQEISLRIYRQIEWLREPKVFRAWAYRIATRIAMAQVKKEKRWKAVESDPELLAAVPNPSPAHPGEVDAAFLEMTDRVSPASRAVLLLHYQQHLSLEETAAILDLPLGTVKSRLAYGVAKLRRLFEEKKL